MVEPKCLNSISVAESLIFIVMYCYDHTVLIASPLIVLTGAATELEVKLAVIFSSIETAHLRLASLNGDGTTQNTRTL